MNGPSHRRSAHALVARIAATFILVAIGAFFALADWWLLTEVREGVIGVPLAFTIHAVLALAAALAIRPFTCTWRGALPLGLWSVLMGPVGLAAITIVLLAQFWRGSPPGMREEWYRQLSGSNEEAGDLAAALRDGRAYRPEGRRLAPFAEIMATGTVRQKQAVLGLIAQGYEPAFLDLLMGALNSPEVAVRASAAAVLARLRDRQAEAVKRAGLLAASAEPMDLLTAADLFDQAAASGLVEAMESQRLANRAVETRRAVVAGRVVPLAAHPVRRQGRLAAIRAAFHEAPPTAAAGSEVR